MTETGSTANEVEQAHTPLTWNFRDVSHATERYREALAKQLGVNPSELVALGHIHKDGPITPNVLATRLDFTTGSVTALVDRLEQGAGMVERSPNPGDRRSILISATEKGAKAMDDIYTDLDRAMHEATADFTPAEITRFSEAMEHIARQLEQHINEVQS